MIYGIVVNKSTYKLIKESCIEKPIPKFNGFPIIPLNSVKIYLKPKIRYIKIFYDKNLLSKELNEEKSN